MQQSSAKYPTPSATPQPQQASLPPKPNYDPFSSLASSGPSSRSTTPAPPSLFQSQQAAKPRAPSSDPFAAISKSSQSHVPTPSPSATLFDLAQSTPPQPQTTISSHQASNGASADDDWNFASALPEDTAGLPSTNDLTVSSTSVKISFQVTRTVSTDNYVSIRASFSNNTNNLITEYTFQVAVTKASLQQQKPVHLLITSL